MNIYSKSIYDIEKHTQKMFLNKSFFKNIYKNNSLNQTEKKTFKKFYKKYMKEKKEFNLHLLEKYKIGELATISGGGSSDEKGNASTEYVPEEYKTSIEKINGKIFDDKDIEEIEIDESEKVEVNAIMKCRKTIFYNLNGQILPIDLFNQCVRLEKNNLLGEADAKKELEAFKIKLSCYNDYNIDYKNGKELSIKDKKKLELCIQTKMKNEDLIIDTSTELQYKIKETVANLVQQVPRLFTAIPSTMIAVLKKIGIFNIIHLQISSPTTVQIYIMIVRWMVKTVCMILQQQVNIVSEAVTSRTIGAPYKIFDEIMHEKSIRKEITFAYKKGMIAMVGKIGSFIRAAEPLFKTGIQSGLFGILTMFGGSSLVLTPVILAVSSSVSSVICIGLQAAVEEFSHYATIKKELSITYDELDSLSKVIIGCFLPTLYNEQLR